VVVEDDGHGFDAASVGDGLGLVGMRERVELTGGRLGTRVAVTLPA
jgi:signal transduction histidine kinase